MKTYLVTGGAGFIGSNFVLHVLAEHADARVVNVDALTYAGNLNNLKEVESDPRHVFAHADIRDFEAMAHLFAENDFDYVVNFAAESHVDRSIADPDAFVSTNVGGVANMLRCAREAWERPDGTYPEGKRFLQVSTDEVYGSLPLEEPEALFREDTPLDPHSPYSATKAAADMLAKAYFDTYGMPCVITRCSNNYGPFQFPEKLIPLAIGRALRHETVPVYGDGMNVRDWLYVEDHCRAIDTVLREGHAGEVYNVGGRNERSNIYIAKRILRELAEATGDPAIDESLVEFVEDRKGHDRRYGIDASKIARKLGWVPETTFEDGIARTIRWYMNHRE